MEAGSEGPGTAANSTPPDTIRVRVCGQRLSDLSKSVWSETIRVKGCGQSKGVWW